MDIAVKIKELIQQIVEENNYIIDSVEYVREGGNNFLRIVIDKNGIIDIDDCVNVTNLINPLLDKEDPIKDNYILDVCSKEKGCE